MPHLAPVEADAEPQQDFTCTRFRELSETLSLEAMLSGDATLLTRVDAFLSRYQEGPQVLPRSPIERLTAQQLLRQVLVARRCYGTVYGWYEAFKCPYGRRPGDFSVQVRQLESAAEGFSWIRGYGTVLECGCGPQSLGLLLGRHNRHWIASDIYEPGELAPLKAHFDPVGSFEFRLIDGVTLDGVPDTSVDVVISRSFFEHLLIEDGLRHLRQAHRVLRPNGEFVCLCPAGIGSPSDVTREFPEFDTPQGLHIKEYRVRELAAELERAGFARVRSRFVRARGLGRLPVRLNRLNQVPPAVAGVVEAVAQSTWPLCRRSPPGRRAWSFVWGHLGATPLKLIATKA